MDLKRAKPYPTDLGELYDFSEPLVLRCAPHGSEVLDVGCGDGRLAKLLLDRRGARVLAFDINPERLEEAREMNPGPQYVFGDAEDVNFLLGLGRFDIVLARNSFHHFARKDDFLNFVPLLLKPGKLFLCIDLDWRANFCWLAVLATHLRFIITHKPARSVNLLRRTRLFLSKSMRQHRQADRFSLRAQGWYGARSVRRNFRRLLPGVEVRRIGTLLGFGGAYVAIWRSEGGTKCVYP